MLSLKLLLAAGVLSTALLAAPVAQAAKSKLHLTTTKATATPAKAAHKATHVVKTTTKSKTSAKAPGKTITKTVTKKLPAKTAAKVTH